MDYIFRFRYNQREDCWYFDIQTIDEVDLIKGLKCTVGWPLLRGRQHEERLPKGQLMVTSDDETNDSPPGLDDLAPGGRCRLMYLTPQELV